MPDLVVGLVATERRIDLDEDQLRYQQPKRPPNLSCHQFRDQGQHSLPRTAKLGHISAQIVGLRDGGQKAPSRSGRTYRVASAVRRSGAAV